MAKSFPMWIYHQKNEAKIIDSKDFDACKKQGWQDSPAKCKSKK